MTTSNKVIISGIQQVGVGVSNAEEAWVWYRKHFSMDVPVFKDAATAALMQRYTGGQPQERYAILAINMAGGGGFEIWQYTQRTPVPPAFTVHLGDLGIFAAKIKCRDVAEMFAYSKKNNLSLLTELAVSPNGEQHFFVSDPYGNVFEIVEEKTWYKNRTDLTGGIGGCVIGVTDIDRSIKFYKNVLGYDQIVFDETGEFNDLKGLTGGSDSFRRVLLRHTAERTGGFSKLFGPSQIELVQVLNRTPKKIFENRYWGDLGFIHLCFDVNGMKALEQKCADLNYPFTVNSAESFDMGEAAGHFTYTEDPDGTLIEFVETHKVPIMKKFGLYLNLKKRNPEKNLPNWMINALSLSRVKE
jgi:catechol 2,3-dioxygenase-like lactoylglutathione lyase family enzyme